MADATSELLNALTEAGFQPEDIRTLAGLIVEKRAIGVIEIERLFDGTIYIR